MMENKTTLKKYILISTVCLFACIITVFIISYYEYKVYTKNYNEKIEAVLNHITKEYKNVDEKELIKILNGQEKEYINLKKYGIDVEKDSIIIENDNTNHKFLAIKIAAMVFFIVIWCGLFFFYERKRNRDIKDIIRCIEQINKKNYELDIDGISEDELSILKNEIYKTTLMLKEEAENATKDKLNLKEYISDISHQLKTPLTSILIMLDNIIDDEDMDSEVREEFVRSIKRDIGNINKLVQILLKLSRLETNTVKFLKKEICIQNILDEVLQNVESISDLKDVKIEVRGNNEYTINCDQMWQVEAITNIVKNAIEHSNEGSKVLVDLEDNNVYSSVSVTNYGVSISEEDRANIFKRFYKGKNQSKDSVGIGLALAKSIVENDSGRISVESLENGVRFSIKYFKM